MYDVAVIGAGAAGIEAAKRALRNKLKIILIDKDYESFGGTCLNKGCIPAKYYLNNSKHNEDLKSIYESKNKIIDGIKHSTLDYIKKQGVDVVWSDANFVGRNTINTAEGVIEASNIIIATGSHPFELIKVDREKVFFAEDIFSLSHLPQRFLIVGAGAVGLEIACFLNNLKKDVLVIEKEKSALPRFDKSLSTRLKIILERKGIKIKLNEDINNYNIDDFDMVLLSAGRKPNTDNLGIENAGLTQNRGWITTDEYLKTNIDNIYACGDVTGDKLLAYIAEDHSRVAIDNISGAKRKVDYLGLAQSVFTQPQLAAVGMMEGEAKEKNIKYETVKSNFLRFSSAYAYSDTNGFIQVLFDKDESVLGAAVISNIASELISIFSLAIKHHIKISQIGSSTFIHPTLSEIIPKLLEG